MNYRYQRSQLFFKKLPVPKDIERKVFNCTLSLREYFEYELEDKIPISCINSMERPIIERFGIEKCRNLDFDLLDKCRYYIHHFDVLSFLLNLPPEQESINDALYELARDKMRPSDYTKSMKEKYPERVILEESDNPVIQSLIMYFNEGKISLSSILAHWELFENKDLTYVLQHERDLKKPITDSELKEFMKKHSRFAKLLVEHSKPYEFFENYPFGKEEEENDYIKTYTDQYFDSVMHDRYSTLSFTNEEFETIFQYSDLRKQLESANPYYAHDILEELESLPEGYIFHTQIPFKVFLQYDVLAFIGLYGLKNVVDFDNECGHFFTKDNCFLLKNMYNLYLRYDDNNHNPNTNFRTKRKRDDEDEEHFLARGITKDEFYEAMRRMLLYGPTDENLTKLSPNYQDITGEFRVKNQDLFFDEVDAPDELRQLFYTKSITPELLAEHPEYKQYLIGKNLDVCFSNRKVHLSECEDHYSSYPSLYHYLTTITDYSTALDILVEYKDLFNIVYSKNKLGYYDIFDVKADYSVEDFKKAVDDYVYHSMVMNRTKFPSDFPTHFIKKHPKMFLREDAPDELKKAYYSREIDSQWIHSHPEYIEYLKDIDLEILYPCIFIEDGNLVQVVEDYYLDDAFDFLLNYFPYIQIAYDNGYLHNWSAKSISSREEFEQKIYEIINKIIVDGKTTYTEDMPDSFKQKYPTLFLSDSFPQDFRDKFYHRELQLSDLEDPNTVEQFGNTNIACGFPLEYSWVIPRFAKEENQKLANYNRLKYISSFSKITDVILQEEFIDYVNRTGDNSIHNIDQAAEVLRRLEFTNSSEMYTFRKELSHQILQTNNPIDSLNKIEDMFIRNKIPTVGKIYSCFDILHHNFYGFDLSDRSMVSPVLKKSSLKESEIIVFSDLIKASFGSNNRTVKSFLDSIEIGTNLYKDIKAGKKSFDDLTPKEIDDFTTFSKQLTTLYNNTKVAKEENHEFESSGDVLKDVQTLEKLLAPHKEEDYSLEDRIIKMFCGFAGINTFEKAKAYFNIIIHQADERNRETARKGVTLEKGDFVKGLVDIRYLRSSLQNGCVSKEFLGSSASSDKTPLDTDLSVITTDGTIKQQISSSNAGNYGPVWVVLKNDDRFVMTRDGKHDLDVKRDMSKLEVFYTGAMGADHYGIRTGFASSEIDYLVMYQYDPRVGLEIAMNGFYIPVFDGKGKLIFSPQDYDELRHKMSGLAYYGLPEYEISSHLLSQEVLKTKEEITQNFEKTRNNNLYIRSLLAKTIQEAGVERISFGFHNDLVPGLAEIYSTGSTARGTNVPNDSDYDFLIKIDREILSDPKKYQEFRNKFKKNLGFTDGYDDKLVGTITLENGDSLDIEISICPRTDQAELSTDSSLDAKLNAIKEQYPDNYLDVLANIVYAKQLFKSVHAYKSLKSDSSQGGLGGIGIENWILQHGGSLEDAARSFVEAAEKAGSFEEFKKVYTVFDLGDNHYAQKKGIYPHDNFVGGEKKMSEEGFERMLTVLKQYLKSLEMQTMMSPKIEGRDPSEKGTVL